MPPGVVVGFSVDPHRILREDCGRVKKRPVMLAAVKTVTKADPVWAPRRQNTDIPTKATTGEALHAASPLKSYLCANCLLRSVPSDYLITRTVRTAGQRRRATRPADNLSPKRKYEIGLAGRLVLEAGFFVSAASIIVSAGRTWRSRSSSSQPAIGSPSRSFREKVADIPRNHSILRGCYFDGLAGDPRRLRGAFRGDCRHRPAIRPSSRGAVRCARPGLRSTRCRPVRSS
jgi:hypothetical protein